MKYERGLGFIALIFSVLVISAFVAFSIYLIRLDNIVRDKFEGQRWDIPAKVFARPMEIYVNAPVIGVNRGRLGFLTDIKPTEVIFKLDQVLKGEFQLERRFLLELEIRSKGEIIHDAIALNDVVLHSGKSVHMIDFELNIDGQYVYRQHSDGLIVSTPTGSTAYALSGGGPIVHPSMDAIVLVPMHPHTLSSRPIVVGGHSEIKLVIRKNRVMPMVSADGQHSISLNVGDTVHIRKHPFKLQLLHPPGYDFYMACRTKLGWNQDFDYQNRD